jgi:hypothetical protein
MSGEKYRKHPGLPETEYRCSLMTGSNLARYFNSAKKFPGLGPLTSDSLLSRTAKSVEQDLKCRIDMFKNFSLLCSCIGSLLLEMAIN